MTDAARTWKRLRIKTDATNDDTDWVGGNTTPNRLTFLVGGTDTAGVYSIRLVGKVRNAKTSQQFDVDFTATFTRVAENAASIATDLQADFDAGTINAASPVLLSTLGIVSTRNSATLTVVFPPGAEITVTTSAPAPGTITSALGLVVPITASAPHFARGGESSMNGVVVVVNQLNASNAIVAVGTGTQPTFDMQGVEICEVETVDDRGDRTYLTRYARTTTLTGCVAGNEYQLPLRGAAYWTVRITNDADLVATTTQFEVIYRDAAT
jgi:hypothetical protein